MPGAYGSTPNPFKWNAAAGYQHVPFTGLYHVGAREYDPRTARWLQRDPIGQSSGDPNVYRYCGNDAVNLADPSGLDILIIQVDNQRAGLGQGTHLRIYIEDDSRNRRGWWFGFYVKGGGGRTNGPGFIQQCDDPTDQEWKKGDRVVLDVTPQQARAMMELISKQLKDIPDYRLSSFNCATWASHVLRAGLGNSLPILHSPQALAEFVRNAAIDLGVPVLEEESVLRGKGVGDKRPSSGVPRQIR